MSITPFQIKKKKVLSHEGEAQIQAHAGLPVFPPLNAATENKFPQMELSV